LNRSAKYHCSELLVLIFSQIVVVLLFERLGVSTQFWGTMYLLLLINKRGDYVMHVAAKKVGGWGGGVVGRQSGSEIRLLFVQFNSL
jgi:hypothetical protein